MFSLSNFKKYFIAAFLLFPFSSFSIEITPYFGQMFANDFIDENDDELSVDSSDSIGLGIAWKDGPNGLGQILITSTKHDFDNNFGSKSEMDVIYAHFNGVAQFRHQNYVTLVSIGVGGAYYDVDGGHDDVFPSLTAALGTKYQIDENFAIVTELRGYATLTDEDSDLFCQGESCLGEFDNALWFETSISLGVSYSF